MIKLHQIFHKIKTLNVKYPTSFLKTNFSPRKCTVNSAKHATSFLDL